MDPNAATALAEVAIRSRWGVLYDDAASQAFKKSAAPDAAGERVVDVGLAEAHARPSRNLAR